MRNAFYSVTLALFTFGSSTTNPGGREIVSRMYERYAGKWPATFTFQQQTQLYQGDSLIRKETWYEAIQFPDKLRIDFGPAINGNAVLFLRDSAYHFVKGKLTRMEKRENELVFLLGGLYFLPKEAVFKKFETLGFDPDKSFAGKWKGKPVLVVGASFEGEQTNQLWIDRKRLVPVRLLKFTARRKEEILFDGHIRLGKGWTETNVMAFYNDKLVQTEAYHDCRANPALDARLFDPARFMEWHWSTRTGEKR